MSNTGRNKRRAGIAVNLLIAALVLLGAAIYGGCGLNGTKTARRGLEIRDAAGGRLYSRWPLEDNAVFSVEFIHSVHQSPVRETFMAVNGELKPQAVYFSSFGAGMLSDLDEFQEMRRDGDNFVITGFNQSFREINYIVGTVSDHLLYINGEIVSLRELCGKNAHITIKIK